MEGQNPINETNTIIWPEKGTLQILFDFHGNVVRYMDVSVLGSDHDVFMELHHTHWSLSQCAKRQNDSDDDGIPFM